MSNGVDFRKLALGLREELTAAQSELAALREELAEIKESLAYRGSLLNRTEQRLTAAEQRNANVYLQLGDLLTDLQGQYPSARIEEIQSLLTKPTESGASD